MGRSAAAGALLALLAAIVVAPVAAGTGAEGPACGVDGAREGQLLDGTPAAAVGRPPLRIRCLPPPQAHCSCTLPPLARSGKTFTDPVVIPELPWWSPVMDITQGGVGMSTAAGELCGHGNVRAWPGGQGAACLRCCC